MNPFTKALEAMEARELDHNAYADEWLNSYQPSPKSTKCCTTGAILIGNAMPFTAPNFEELCAHFCRANGLPPEKNASTVVFSWNDDPKRTKEDVLTALRKAADAFTP